MTVTRDRSVLMAALETHPDHHDPYPELVPSVEPSVVFSSLAAQCVPEFCDQCAVDVVDGPSARYRIVHPLQGTRAGGLRRLSDQAAAESTHRVEVDFAHQHDVGDDPRRFRGVATFVWDRRAATATERAMATLLVEHAVQLVVWQRCERRTHTETSKVRHLETALQTNRHIGAAAGILMSLHKITAAQAIELLRLVSHQRNRKLHDLALDVLETGWLDPALLPART